MPGTIEPSKDYEVFDEDMEFRIKEISEFINANTPEGAAVITLLAKNGDADQVQFFFMSNLERSEMLRLLRAYLASEEAKQTNGPGE